MGKYDGTIREA